MAVADGGWRLAVGKTKIPYKILIEIFFKTRVSRNIMKTLSAIFGPHDLKPTD